MIIADKTYDDLDISTEATICEYTHTLDDTLATARIKVGSEMGSNALIGGEYTITFYVNDVPILPVSIINVDKTVVIFQGRSVSLKTNDALRITIVGQTGDISVDIVTTLILTVTEDELSRIVQEQVTDVVNTIKNLSITVRPERTILGPCKRKVVTGLFNFNNRNC